MFTLLTKSSGMVWRRLTFYRNYSTTTLNADCSGNGKQKKVITILRYDGGLNQDNDSDAAEKQLNSGCIWSRFADKLDCMYERKESSNTERMTAINWGKKLCRMNHTEEYRSSILDMITLRHLWNIQRIFKQAVEYIHNMSGIQGQGLG